MHQFTEEVYTKADLAASMVEGVCMGLEIEENPEASLLCLLMAIEEVLLYLDDSAPQAILDWCKSTIALATETSTTQH